MTPRERLKAGSSGRPVKPFMMHIPSPPPLPVEAGKPWDDKDEPPYPGGGDVDGEGDNTHKYGPGEEVSIPPAPSPNTDNLNLRASLDAAAEASRDPEVQQAMRAIEARLAEITQYMRVAGRGASKDMAIKLAVLDHIL